MNGWTPGPPVIMLTTRRLLGSLLLAGGACVTLGAAATLIAWTEAPRPGTPAAAANPQGRSQDQAPSRRDVSIVARDYRFVPDRIEVSQDDLVKVTVTSGDVAYGFTIDEYRIARRIPAGGSSVLEFRADTPGTFTFYSNLTSDARHRGMRGQLVVKPR